MQAIHDDVATHKEEAEELLAVTTRVQETHISTLVSGTVTRYKSLVMTVDSRVSLLEKSVEVHETFCSECRQCHNMIVNARQQLQQIRAASQDSIDAVQQRMDQLKVVGFFLFLMYCCNVAYYIM